MFIRGEQYPFTSPNKGGSPEFTRITGNDGEKLLEGRLQRQLILRQVEVVRRSIHQGGLSPR